MFHQDYGVGYHAGGGLLLLILVLVVIGAAIAVVVALTSQRKTPAQSGSVAAPAPTPSDAARILDERFARGEIDDDEYRRRRALLHSAP